MSSGPLRLRTGNCSGGVVVGVEMGGGVACEEGFSVWLPPWDGGEGVAVGCWVTVGFISRK